MADRKTWALGRILGMALAILGVWSHPSLAQGVDVYVIYSRDSKADKVDLVEDLSRSYAVKSYNSDLLVVADYSAKQKAVARFSSARIVILLAGRSFEVLKGSTIRAPLLIANSAQSPVDSDAGKIHVVTRGTDLKNLGDGAKIVEITDEASLRDMQSVIDLDAIVVDEAAVKLPRAIRLIAGTVLKQS